MQNVLEKIYKSGLKLLVPLTLQETYSMAVHEAIKLVGGTQGTITLSGSNILKVAYYSYGAKDVLKIRRKGFTYQSFTSKQAFVVNCDKLKRIHPELIASGVKSMIFIPLSYKNQAIGVLSIRSDKENHFKDKDLSTLKLFGSMVSLAITKARLYDQTQNLVKAQDLFLSIAAHEFRTPLTTINGYAQLLQSKSKTTSEDTSEHRWLKELNYECTRLSKLVNELLDISRIKTNRFQYDLRHIRIQEILQKAIITFNFNHPENKLKFTNYLREKQAFVIGDSNKLIQVITNILDNATKFSPIQSPINISLKSKPPYIVLEIKDQGHGISSADLPKVFEGFYRGHGTSASGLGIGLFLCKSIIDHHHGIIDIRSKPSKGTSVIVKLPQAKI